MALNAELPNSFFKKNPVTHLSISLCQNALGAQGNEQGCCVWEREGKEKKEREDRGAQKEMGRKRRHEGDGRRWEGRRAETLTEEMGKRRIHPLRRTREEVMTEQSRDVDWERSL